MNIITKAEAITLGLNSFFPGTPCVKGHISDWRLRKNGRIECGECARIRCVEWRLKNKVKVSEYNKTWYENNKDHKSQTSSARYLRNPELHRERSRAWYRLNKSRLDRKKKAEYDREYRNRPEISERLKELQAAWVKQNRGRIAEYRRTTRRRYPEQGVKHKAIRRARMFNACPDWVDKSALREIYKTCPDGYHVDHDIPLAHPLVCGLHVPANLKVLPARENQIKSNKFDPDSYVHELPELR